MDHIVLERVAPRIGARTPIFSAKQSAVGEKFPSKVGELCASLSAPPQHLLLL
ncbi:predicted protein [Plenodomus lingam JN3]|uniref:Predicted protein n=1 Tax=Leptosphaeria maculans (strain JN3 / isolate v23.1.3 / race Av1-4-5-6-7-8) TaxID=985895 RepID=E5A8A6_LEPMJ|nr:predicted protein [Plenodomus lingam JN3]CBX99851.1 predicted protein [Plenodomus lingam JN3]